MKFIAVFVATILSLTISTTAFAQDCVDTCTNVEVNCLQACFEGDLQKQVQCSNRCTTARNACHKKFCTPESPKSPDQDETSARVSAWTRSYPIRSAEVGGLETDSCCSVAKGARHPFCAFVSCAAGGEDIGGNQQRIHSNWSGLLFDAPTSPKADNVCAACAANPSLPICRIIKCGEQPSNVDTKSLGAFKRQLEGLRLASEFSRETGQLSLDDYKTVIEAYKADARNTFRMKTPASASKNSNIQQTR